MEYPRGGYPSCQRMSYAMNVYCPDGYWEYAMVVYMLSMVQG
jgi:hypothetical protein